MSINYKVIPRKNPSELLTKMVRSISEFLVRTKFIFSTDHLIVFSRPFTRYCLDISGKFS